MDAQALFKENFIAARSLRSFWTRGASTSGCLYVRITNRDLIVKCHWYSGWLIHAFFLDLHHSIPRSRLISAYKAGKPFNIYKDIVHIKFRDKAGAKQSLELYMNHADKFLRILDVPEDR